jgi:hypothetical protein
MTCCSLFSCRLLNYDYTMIREFDPKKFTYGKVLNSFEIVPSDEYPDTSDWVFNNHVYTSDSNNGRVYSVWKTYPPRSTINTLLCHDYIRNVTIQGPHYRNYSVVSLFLDDNLLLAIVNVDSTNTYLYDVNVDTMELKTKKLDLTAYGRAALGSVYHQGNLFYHSVNLEYPNQKQHFITVLDMKNGGTLVNQLDISEYPMLDNLFIYVDTGVLITVYNDMSSSLKYSIYIIEIDIRSGKIITKNKIDTETDAPVIISQAITEQSELVFTYTYNFSMFGHSTACVIYQIKNHQIISEKKKRFTPSPYQLIHV